VFVPLAQVTDTVNKYTNHIFVYSLLVRTSGRFDVTAIERAVHEVDPDQPIIAVRPVTDLMRQTMDFSRLLMQLMGLFATLAIVLTAIGIYGLLSFYVARRTHEIGIRMALGAARSQVLRMIVREGLLLVSAGASAGVIGALAGARLMKGFVYGIREADPVSFVVASLVLLSVAIIAAWVPARRATRVDPMVALRYE
jgi:ABC-type antimicrobial peptide transport system permease subunit